MARGTEINIQLHTLHRFILSAPCSDIWIRCVQGQVTADLSLGVACDVELVLEETRYIPKDRVSNDPEIRDHIRQVAQRWDLKRHVHFHTETTAMEWDDSLFDAGTCIRLRPNDRTRCLWT